MPKSKRVGLSPKTRFEVFKRDGFTCRYCGRKTPQVVLQVDHVIAVADGGGDGMDNLVTSCWECNIGKGARPLFESAPVTDVESKMILMLERERQMKEYNEVRRAVRDRENAQIDELLDFWRDLWTVEPRQTPAVNVLRKYLRFFAVEDIKVYMEIAADKAGDYRGAKYLAGILRNKASDMDETFESEGTE